MSARRKTDQSLVAEAASHRIALRAEQERHAETRTALREANRLLLRLALGDRLKYPNDLVIFIGGLDVVLDDVGRLDWERVDRLTSGLLEERPDLAAPKGADASRMHADAVSSVPTGSVLAIATDPEQAAQGATRSEPGAGADGDTHPTESQ